jgi:protein gp37
MSEKTLIAWTDKTFNAVWGCTKVSPGCAHCYADTLAERYGHDIWGKNKPRRTFGLKHWQEPLKWNRQAQEEGTRYRVFCGSMFDWAEDHPTTVAEIKKLWPLIRDTEYLDWQLLSKREDRIALTLPPDWGDGYFNVWLGVSIENNDYVHRADVLRAIPATVRFISYEPALGPLEKLDLTGIDWLIFGGESGPGFRQMNIQWARDIKARCEAQGTAFFYKQSAAYRTEMGIQLDGQIVRNYPQRRIELPQLF